MGKGKEKETTAFDYRSFLKWCGDKDLEPEEFRALINIFERKT